MMKTNSKPTLSVIMPVYNAMDTVSRAILSILDTHRKNQIEILVVDDCSKDDTQRVITDLQKIHSNITLLAMSQNSGGPSAPRNLAIEHARGEYITFVDDDDWVDADNMMKLLDYAKSNNHELVKGYLYVVTESSKSIRNRLHKIPNTTEETIRDMVAHQSTTSDFVVRRHVLIDHNIRYPTNIRIGEDTMFFLEILSKCSSVGYLDNFFWYHSVNALDPMNPSSTQQCDDREISHQIEAWERSEALLSTIHTSYYELRLHVGFRNLLTSIIRFSNGIQEETYHRLHQFTTSIKGKIKGKMNLHKRYEELYQAILSGNYAKYLDTAKRRLLINGYDLKFVLPLVPYFEKNYNVVIDEWTGHATHDKKKSEQLCNWADIFWCEWLLGNAVFYASHKNVNQRLIVRAHRFELEREFGYQLDLSKADMVFAVSYYYFEKFAQQFSIPRSKMRLLPNYVEEAIYSTKKSPDFRFHIGLVGILPKRKGVHKALELLLKLKEEDHRFKLYLMGKRPSEVSWINNNPSESDYYKSCASFITDNNLTESVVYGGYKGRSELYDDIGYVLSLSDYEDRPESFHLSLAEGACAGSTGLILRWPGVEYIYPRDIVFDSLDDIAQQILVMSTDDVAFEKRSNSLKNFILEQYRIDKFLKIVDIYLKQIFMIW